MCLAGILLFACAHVRTLPFRAAPARARVLLQGLHRWWLDGSLGPHGGGGSQPLPAAAAPASARLGEATQRGQCGWCAEGQNQLCPERGMRSGEKQSSHGFSQYDVCVASNLHPISDAVSFGHAALLDCYACGVHAANRSPLARGSRSHALARTSRSHLSLAPLARTSCSRIVHECGAPRGAACVQVYKQGELADTLTGANVTKLEALVSKNASDASDAEPKKAK